MKKNIKISSDSEDIFLFLASYFVHFQLTIFDKISEQDKKKTEKRLRRFNQKLLGQIRSIALSFIKEYKGPVKQGKINIEILPEKQEIIFFCKGTPEEIKKWTEYKKKQFDILNLSSNKKKILTFEVFDDVAD